MAEQDVNTDKWAGMTSMTDLVAMIQRMEQDHRAYKDTAEEIQRAYLQTHQERYKMNEALVKIAKKTKLDAFAFNEPAATIYGIALEAMGVNDIRLD